MSAHLCWVHECYKNNDRMLYVTGSNIFDGINSCQELIVKIRSFVDVDGRIILTEFYKIGINESGLMKFHVDLGTG